MKLGPCFLTRINRRQSPSACVSLSGDCVRVVRHFAGFAVEKCSLHAGDPRLSCRRSSVVLSEILGCPVGDLRLSCRRLSLSCRRSSVVLSEIVAVLVGTVCFFAGVCFFVPERNLHRKHWMKSSRETLTEIFTGNIERNLHRRDWMKSSPERSNEIFTGNIEWNLHRKHWTKSSPERLNEIFTGDGERSFVSHVIKNYYSPASFVQWN